MADQTDEGGWQLLEPPRGRTSYGTPAIRISSSKRTSTRPNPTVRISIHPEIYAPLNWLPSHRFHIAHGIGGFYGMISIWADPQGRFEARKAPGGRKKTEIEKTLPTIIFTLGPREDIRPEQRHECKYREKSGRLLISVPEAMRK